MAPKKAAKAKLVFLKPKLLVLAASCAWAAANEPASFTAASAGVWLAGTLTTALLAAAALSLALPAARVATGILRDALHEIQKGLHHK